MNKKLLFACIISLSLHGLILHSFLLYGSGQGETYLGDKQITNFELRKKSNNTQETNARKKPRKTKIDIASNEPTITKAETDTLETPNKTDKPPGMDTKNQNESLGSASSLLGLKRPLTPEEKYKLYLHRKLNHEKFYPIIAQKLGHEGQVKVLFTINKNGEFSLDKIVPCPFSRLNEATIKTFKSLGKFKPFPNSIDKINWSFDYIMNYSLN